MNLQGTNSFVLLPEQELDALKTMQLQILEGIKRLHLNSPKPIMADFITAVEFMAAVKIRRSKFDQLVLGNKIKTIKKKRKIYVPVSEIDRYFKDPSVQ